MNFKTEKKKEEPAIEEEDSEDDFEEYDEIAKTVFIKPVEQEDEK
jgi:hypothetical protein